MSAWLLPAHIADALPAEARRLEELRRVLLDEARRFGYELVMPPLLEYVESLLTGSGQTLDLQTFKLVDQLTGRTLGIRADTTPQVARIDAHLLNRQGTARLCYCGPVLHTRPLAAGASREPLQFGAELYGHAGLEADLETVELAVACLNATQVPLKETLVEFADIRIVRGILSLVAANVAPSVSPQIYLALAKKDATALRQACNGLPTVVADGLKWLLKANGSATVLVEAYDALPNVPLIRSALNDLVWLSQRTSRFGVRVGVDLSELGAEGYAYYSGMRFACYAAGPTSALIRGGRYDEVGAVFGRSRPAVGFSVDVRQLADVARLEVHRSAVRAPWGEAEDLELAVRNLRRQGETVVRVLPGHEGETDEFDCDRELVEVGGRWVLKALG